MAVNGKAWAHGSATHAARVLRNMNAAVMGQPWGTHANSATATTRGGSYGVVGDGDLLVTTTGALGYSIAAGKVMGPGTFAAAQGGYTGYNDAAVTGTFTARHATLTRTDYVCWRVRDTDEDATGSEDDALAVIDGTAGGGVPSVPSSLGTLVILSEVTVPSAAAGTPLTFTDRRTKASALGGVVVCTSATRPTGIAQRVGMVIYETDTGAYQWWTGAAWRYQYKPVAAYTPTASGGWGLGNGSWSCDWMISAGLVKVRGRLLLGSTTFFPASLVFALTAPVTGNASVNRTVGSAWLYDASATQVYPATADMTSGGTLIQILNVGGTTGTYNIGSTLPFVWAAGDEVVFELTYPVA